MGSLDSGLKNDHGILLAKSVIDFAGSVAFASSMGIGIVFSGLSVLAVEGVMTLLASLLTGVLTDAVITEISVTDDHRHHPERAGRHQAAYPEHDAGAAAARSAVQIHVSALIKRST